MKKNINKRSTNNKKGRVNNKKNDKVLIILIIFLIITTLSLVIVKIINRHNLKNNDELVVELHNYFNTENLENCAGLFIYNEKIINYDNISSKNKKCLAYQKSDIKNSEDVVLSAKKGKNICKKDDMIFKTDENSNECIVKKIDKKIINNTYKKIFGKDIEDEESFRIDNYNICYLKDDFYYCGLSETYTYTIGNDSMIYRIIEKAIEKGSTIEIYDYFIKINNNICYNNYTTDKENNDCTEEYKNNSKINYKFMKKFGTEYKHVFKKSNDDTYYWISSEPITSEE